MQKNLKIGDRVEVKIERLSFTGKGIGRLNNFVIFIPNTIPGDHVKAEIYACKRRYADAKAVEYVQRSPDSVAPECRHFEICGGCSFQNLPYQLQLEAKQEAVREHLRRIGKIEDPPLENIIGCEEQYFYRNKMEFSFKPDENNSLRLGLHHRGEWEKIFDVEKCLLQSEFSNTIVSRVREFFRQRNVPAYHLSEHYGYLRFLTIRESSGTGEAMMILVTNQGELEHKDDFIDMVRNEFPQVVSIMQVINTRKANVAMGESETVLWGRNFITEKLGDYEFRIRPSSFFQTNSRQTQILYDTALRLGEFGPEEKVLDLYTGCGTIAIYISGRVKSVLGVELNPDAVTSARENAEVNGVENCRFETADVRKSLDEMVDNGERFDTVIIDPPRAGIGRKIVSRIGRLSPEKIIYVSCNPSTLAGDIMEFGQAGYMLEKTVPVDMFPHTFHIESVSRLSRAEKGSE
jgi:23S rRNA (uracil1939-C5)-methyltransferase